MNSMNFNQEWYGSQAKVLTQAPDCIVVDYGCNGRGIVKNYNLFEGIQLCFLDFNTDETMVSKKFNSDIIQITHCRSGRYECEFLNHTVSYLPEGYFGVAGTEYLPISFSFPLKKYIGVSLVIDKHAILKSDDYLQLPRIQKLWNTISSSELLADRHKAQGLLDNLCKSEFNIIASYSNDVNTSIQYFLDVNLKGIRLDTEDIFKGYLFSQDSRELTRSLWQKNKRDVLRLNGVTQSSEEKRYPLMKLYEHFFYCDLYLPREGDCEYSTLKFGENFCLTSGFESGSTKYYEGSHLIEAIRDRDYLQNVLSRLNKCVEIMTDIIESEGPSTPFKDKFICAKKVDSIDIQNCHSMLKKILMEKEVIPKILVLKYILTYFDGKPHAKEEYKSVYSVFCAAVLFTVFANKKESDTFYNFVRLEEWKSKINKWLYDYISSHALTRGKVLAAYKYSESDDDPIQQIRCKSLAAISNFFKVTKNGDNYNMGISNAAELCKFFGDKTVYSLEHFIVGECGTLHVKTAKYDFPYKYPPTIQKYRNSLFNFIFIPQPLNSSLRINRGAIC